MTHDEHHERGEGDYAGDGADKEAEGQRARKYDEDQQLWEAEPCHGKHAQEWTRDAP